MSNYTLNEKTETTNVSTAEQSIAPHNDSNLNTFENDNKSDFKSSTSETNSSIEMTLEANGEEKKLNGLGEQDSSEHTASTNSNELNVVVDIKNESKENSPNKKEDSIKINSGIF